MKVNFYLKNPSGDFETWIYCLMRYDNLNVKVYTPKKIHPKFWNPASQTFRQTSKLKNHPELNTWLKDVIDYAENIELEWKKEKRGNKVIDSLPVSILIDKMKLYLSKPTQLQKEENNKRTFWGYYDNFLYRMKEGLRVHLSKGTPMAAKTRFQFENLKRHLQNFESYSKKKIDFEGINLIFYKSFVDYLTIKLKLAPNTIGKLITNLKVFLREALEDGITSNNTFTHRKFQSINSKSDTVYLTTEEIKELQKIDLTKKPGCERVRDMFVIGCYTGLRFSDLIKIQPEQINDGMIELTQSKTGNPVIIPLVKDVINILKKYNSTFKSISNQKYNENLYDVCKSCEILKKEITVNSIKGGKKIITQKPKYEFISSHTARRSFATNEYKAGDLEVSEIMAITGHTTEKSFYKYIRETPRETALRIKQKFTEREQKLSAITNHLVAV